MLQQGCPRNQFIAYGSLGEEDIPGDPRYQAGFGHLDDHGNPLPEGYFRLREGIERFLVSDVNNAAASAVAQSEIPVMLDTWAADIPVFGGAARFNHIPGGSNVLYMDGHVEFQKLGTVYPVANSRPGTYGDDLSAAMAVSSGAD